MPAPQGHTCQGAHLNRVAQRGVRAVKLGRTDVVARHGRRCKGCSYQGQQVAGGEPPRERTAKPEDEISNLKRQACYSSETARQLGKASMNAESHTAVFAAVTATTKETGLTLPLCNDGSDASGEARTRPPVRTTSQDKNTARGV